MGGELHHGHAGIEQALLEASEASPVREGPGDENSTLVFDARHEGVDIEPSKVLLLGSCGDVFEVDQYS